MTCGKRPYDFVPWRGHYITARCLSDHDVGQHYLSLRFDVLHTELGWTSGRPVRRPIDLSDDYDDFSRAFGVFSLDNNDLFAAARLIFGCPQVELPSVRLMAAIGVGATFPGRVVEISRVIVRRDFRGRGLFKVLLLSALSIAQAADAGTVIMTEKDDARATRMLGAYGFVKIAAGFSFSDDKIAPGEPAITLALDLKNGRSISAARVSAERDRLLRALDDTFAHVRTERQEITSAPR